MGGSLALESVAGLAWNTHVVTRLTLGLGHTRDEIVGEADTPWQRWAFLCVPQDAGARDGRPTDRVDHNGPGNKGAM